MYKNYCVCVRETAKKGLATNKKITFFEALKKFPLKALIKKRRKNRIKYMV